MHDGLQVATAERVQIDLPVAGLGHRALAWAVDAALIFGALLVVYFVYSLLGPSVLEVAQGLSGVGRAIAGLVTFAVLQGYWTGFEATWRGQTPGKRLLKIRVVRADGTAPGFFELATRNLMRAIDFLPFCYPVGLTSMLVDRHHRRLGDLVAGTLLVREGAIDLGRYARAQHSGLDVQSFELLTSLLARWPGLEPAARVRLAKGALVRLGDTSPPDDEAALKSALERRVAGDGP